jgi:hypothetical protein
MEMNYTISKFMMIYDSLGGDGVGAASGWPSGAGAGENVSALAC